MILHCSQRSVRLSESLKSAFKKCNPELQKVQRPGSRWFGNEHLHLCPACCLETSSDLEYKWFILPLVCPPKKISRWILDPLGLLGALAGQFKIGSGGNKGMGDCSGVCI